MARYFIESVRCGCDFGCGPISTPMVVEAKIRTDTDEVFYMSLSLLDEFPEFYKTPKSTFRMQTHMMDYSPVDFDELAKYSMNAGEYPEIFEKRDPEWFRLYCYLIFIGEAEEKVSAKYRKETKGKYLDEIDVPFTNEAAYLEEDTVEEAEETADEEQKAADEIAKILNQGDREELFKLRLRLETELYGNSAWEYLLNQSPSDGKRRALNTVVEACGPEEEYRAWEERWLGEEYAKLQGKKFRTCTTIFPGESKCVDVFPAKVDEDFLRRIENYGPACVESNRPATEWEIKSYIALHIGE